MRKFMLLALLMYAASCTNPEDKATGNADSTSFNQSGNDQNLNTGNAEDVGNQSNANDADTSSSPATWKQNSDSKTDGTNRSYVPGSKDSTQKK